MAGPYVMGFYLTRHMPWGYGFGTVAAVQFVFALFLFASLPKWRKEKAAKPESGDSAPAAKGFAQILRIRGVKHASAALFGYCALEGTAGLWASSFLVYHRGVGVESAALFASFFFIGITVGRFLTGTVSNRLGDRKMTAIGLTLVVVGICAVWLPLAPTWVCLGGLIVIGLGCAPVFPSLIHATPANFGAENSQAVIGVQMASAYAGATLMPPLFGWLSGIVGLGAFPAFLFGTLAFTVVMVVGMEKAVGKTFDVYNL
jgi:fucose permease